MKWNKILKYNLTQRGEDLCTVNKKNTEKNLKSHKYMQRYPKFMNWNIVELSILAKAITDSL